VKVSEVTKVGFIEHGDEFPNQLNEYQLLTDNPILWSYAEAAFITALHRYAPPSCLTIMLT
jgi:hypothetical protein